MFILTEHECKPLKLRGNKVIPSTISTFTNNPLPLKKYVGLNSGIRTQLINEEGTLNAGPHLREVYYTTNLHPATLGDEAVLAERNELFVLDGIEHDITKFSFEIVNHSITKEDLELIDDYWVPGNFGGENNGWIHLNGNTAILEGPISNAQCLNELSFLSMRKFRLENITIKIKELCKLNF